MSEPLLLVAAIPCSAIAFHRWLDGPADAVFADWPEILAGPPPAAATTTVKDALIKRTANALTCGDGYLMCIYDESTCELHFAAYENYGGSTESRAAMRDLLTLLRIAADFRGGESEAHAVVYDMGNMRPVAIIGIGQGHSEVMESTQPIWPEWLHEWLLTLQEIGPDADLSRSLAPPLLQGLKQLINRGVAMATPHQPFDYDLEFHTDGIQVIQQSAFHDLPPAVVSGADPHSFRRVTAGSDGAAFYADSRQVWYLDFQSRLYRLQDLPNASLRGFNPGGSRASPLLLCGDSIWHLVKTDRKDDTPADRQALLDAIVRRGALLVSAGKFQLQWLDHGEVDGASFRHLGEFVFEDDDRVYLIPTDSALTVLNGIHPGTMKRVGDLWCGVDEAFFWSRRIPLGDGPLRHLGGQYYADDRRGYYLHGTLNSLEGASGELVCAPSHRELAYDDRYAWYEGKLVQDADGASVSAVPNADFHYWQDAQRVYYAAHPLPGAIPEQLHVFPESVYARQGQTIYFMQVPMPEADAHSFEVIDWCSARDARHEYYRDSPRGNDTQ
ncbi:DKNYY domain-containing protein [Paraburkholderia sp. J67]|uniref:DKNYY domain-containing protein n=1 Tax=Paraburkholderia sp. J67 TaxID=2805435 RepID=UPI002ABDF75F|nr:DKNYY domain-containing protein [Paraburkholderia sp. J67]